MKKILSLLLVMLFILAMEVGVYAENGDVDSIEYLRAVQTIPRQYTSLSHHYDCPLIGTGDDERNSIPLLNRLTYTVNSVEEWFEIYSQSPDDNSALAGFFVPMDEGTKEIIAMGTNPFQTDKWVINELDSLRKSVGNNYMELSERDGRWGVEFVDAIAAVRSNGPEYEFTPTKIVHTFCISWKDASDTIHYGRFDAEITPSRNGLTDTDKTYVYKQPAVEKGRLTVTCPNATWEYSAGTIAFKQTDAESNVNISVTVNKPEGYENITNESIELHETLSNAGSGLFRGHWKIEWKDNNNNVVLTEVLYWTLDPMDGTETWMEKNFQPAPASRTAVRLLGEKERSLLKYDQKTGLWCFEIPKGSASNEYDLQKLATEEDFVVLTPPANAKYFKFVDWECPRYHDKTETVKTDLDNMAPVEIVTSSFYRDGKVIIPHGSFLSATTLYGTDIKVYTVNSMGSGIVCVGFFQWFDESNQPIILENDNATEYFGLELKPYGAKVDTDMINIQDGNLDDPNWEGWDQLKGKTEPVVLMTTQDGFAKLFYLRSKDMLSQGSAEGYYELKELSIVDGKGNEMKVSELKKTYDVSKVYIFWPRPLLITNINGDTIEDYEINLKHYINAEGNMLKDEKVKLHIAPLNLGFWFEVESFSPFLLSYKLPAGGTEGADTPGSTGDSYYPSYHGPVQPVLVLPPKTGDITFFGWLRVLLGID